MTFATTHNRTYHGPLQRGHKS